MPAAENAPQTPPPESEAAQVSALPPLNLADEAALRAAEPELAKSIDARLATWEVLEATVDSVNDDAAQVTLADGRKATLAKKWFSSPAPAAGQKIRALLEPSLSESDLQVSQDKADKLFLWAAASLAAEGSRLVEGTVIAKITGGLSVDIGLRAFLPAAQSGVPRGPNGADLETLVGQKLVFGISEFDRRSGEVELARRALVQAERSARRKATLEKIKEGAVLEGVVKNLTDWGAFIDLGGIDGLLHVSDMSWQRVKHPRELLSTGDSVRVQVLKHEAKKISLGMKQLEADPWLEATKGWQPGDKVKGKVKSFTPYGAFVTVAPGVDGLLHLSEITWGRIKSANEKLKEGQELEAQILELDAAQRRLRLGLKQLEQNPWEQVEERFPVGTVFKGQVRNVVDYGLFIGVLEGIDGFVHVSDLSWTERVKHPADLFKAGDEVEVVVLNIDLENERLSLGIKQAQPDPWLAVADAHPVGSTFQGRVTRTTPFGAFVELAPGVEGLIHVSELRDEHVEHPDDVVQENEMIEVRVLGVDTEQHKISLSARKQQQPDDYRQFMNDPALGKASLGEVFGDKLKKS